MQLGAKHIKSLFIKFRQIFTILYFFYFLIIVSLINLLKNSLTKLASKKNTNNQIY